MALCPNAVVAPTARRVTCVHKDASGTGIRLAWPATESQIIVVPPTMDPRTSSCAVSYTHLRAHETGAYL
eukprot:6126991-Pyramimonas_sp.AAC.1